MGPSCSMIIDGWTTSGKSWWCSALIFTNCFLLSDTMMGCFHELLPALWYDVGMLRFAPCLLPYGSWAWSKWDVLHTIYIKQNNRKLVLILIYNFLSNKKKLKCVPSISGHCTHKFETCFYLIITCWWNILTRKFYVRLIWDLVFVRHCGPYDRWFSTQNSNSMKISFCCCLNSNEVITTKFCTCHDSTAVVACAQFYSDLMAENEIMMNIFFD